jgi:hypothetical protein
MENLMSTSKKLATAALAGLLAVSFSGIAQASENGSGIAMVKSASQQAEKEKHACKGQNSCKGQGADGKNDCKGKGSCATDGSK